MDDPRRAWLTDRRAAVMAAYDAEAATYDDEADYPVPLQPSFVRRLVELTPPGGILLDAPCGTGRYFPLITDAGRRVVGIDQSAGMLAQARARGLAVATSQVALQDMAFDRAFDAAMTVDAMEHVPPEDWPLVVANVCRAVRPGGHWYLTVEEADDVEIDHALDEARAKGWPAVRGEVVEGDTAGYHFYPGRERVIHWLTEAGLTIVEEAEDQQDGWGYRHLLVRTSG